MYTKSVTVAICIAKYTYKLYACTHEKGNTWTNIVSYNTIQGRLNSLKVVGAQLTNKTHFYYEKLNSYEHLKILWGQVLPVPPGSATYAIHCHTHAHIQTKWHICTYPHLQIYTLTHMYTYICTYIIMHIHNIHIISYVVQYCR